MTLRVEAVREYNKRMETKKISLIIGFGVVVILSVVGFRYFEVKKIEVEKKDNTQNTISAQSQNIQYFILSPRFCYDDEIYKKSEGAGECFVSPNNQWIVYSTNNGLKLIEVATRKTTQLSKQRYDLAMAWFSDSRRILGFSGSFPRFECDGPVLNDESCNVSDARKLVIWDIDSKTFREDLGVSTPAFSVGIDWMVPDHMALIRAKDMGGTEGDYFSYTLNLDKKSIELYEHYQRKMD